jgi:hypothetical protein
VNSSTTHHPLILTPPCDECGDSIAPHITGGPTHHDVLHLCGVCMAQLRVKRAARIVREGSFA